METLKTNRDLLKVFQKDYRFFPQQHLQPETMRELCRRVGEDSSPMFWRVLATFGHMKEGNQMWVSKEVSDDLRYSSIEDPDFDELVWPHPRLEMVFEDPTIPGFLIQHTTRQEEVDAYRKWARCNDEITIVGNNPPTTELVNILTLTADEAIASVCFKPEDLNRFAIGEDPEVKLLDNRNNTDLSGAEEQGFRELAVLAFKVLLFAASDGFAPRATLEVPTKKQGGKPGFKDRPKTRRWIVEYLPKQQVAKRKENEREAALTHNFRGRHGHWRVYRSEKYVNFRGRREYMWPIPDPVTGEMPKRRFKVVKPKGGIA